jgi:hypothetical protein
MSFDLDKRHQFRIFLGFIGESLDLSEALYQEARRKYSDLGEWLKSDHLERFRSDAQIYPQGSMRLGTSVRPVHPEDEYDVDLVYCREIKKESTTQDQLKAELGDQLNRYTDYLRRTGEMVPNLVHGRRCWTLEYRRQFHMDILPAIPDDEAAKNSLRNIEDGIKIADRDLLEWIPSNPKGYAEWFNQQQEELLLELRKMHAKEAEVEIEKIPLERVPTPLRRAVQILKRHRDFRFKDNPDDKPISIIITTLAASVYHGQTDLLEALTGIIAGMPEEIETLDGKYWIPNPVNPGENFADKWGEKPEKAEIFKDWLIQVDRDIQQALVQSGIHKVAENFTPVFGESVVTQAFNRYGDQMLEQRKSGRLKIATGSGILGTTGSREVPQHTNYGKKT